MPPSFTTWPSDSSSGAPAKPSSALNFVSPILRWNASPCCLSLASFEETGGELEPPDLEPVPRPEHRRRGARRRREWRGRSRSTCFADGPLIWIAILGVFSVNIGTKYLHTAPSFGSRLLIAIHFRVFSEHTGFKIYKQIPDFGRNYS
jgi:hypothetical protein